ncbi:TERF1-interacting nuclear factor 2 [Cololabis saira]|uniref:TERF1-interacting nuclear factor 2 n=1 Tax=Cololabis saira TaxID=129043 RepID=UPI002AD43DDA|nr:TERF1-interacting nuclear factor 2 [Cololabis saira]
MATRKPKGDEASLPFAALQLLAPPVRLVSAALWKVLKQRDVMQYGVVEEFVTAACETVPGLLTLRHQGKLSLGLRARLILELLCTKPDVKVIAPHLERICVPAAPSSSSSSTAKKDVKIMRTVENFHSFIHILLKDPAERERFFKEQFPVDYGPNFDQELEKLFWEFLIRLDQLLPVPNLAQTVSWLSDAPPVLEECAQAATQPQLLRILLQHQTCLGHLEPAASLPPNMGDSILASLSLPPSGRIPSNQQTGANKFSAEQLNGQKVGDAAPFIKPVIGLISNEDVPVMMSSSKKAASSSDRTDEQLNPKENLQFTSLKRKQKNKDDGVKEGQDQPKKKKKKMFLNGNGRMKRKQMDKIKSFSDEDEEEVLAVSTVEPKRTSIQAKGDQRMTELEEDAEDEGNKGCDRELLSTCMSKHGIKTLHLPEDASLRSIFASCLTNQPRVVIEKLSAASASTSRSGKGGKRRLSEHQQTRSLQTSDYPGLDDKENHPVLSSPSRCPSQRWNNTEMAALPDDGNDYVADSEDEATKNFKGRLFVKRYCKTKHGTYVPTLREFWKPGTTRRDWLAAGSKRR